MLKYGTAQKIFSFVVRHLLVHQKKKAVQRSTNTGQWLPKYRTSKGLSCAVGCLIKDEHYNSILEECNLGSPSLKIALDKSGVSTSKRSRLLLEQLMVIHDDYRPAEWKARLKDLAEIKNLKMPKI